MKECFQLLLWGIGMFVIVHMIHFNTQFVSRENIIFQVFHLFYSKASWSVYCAPSPSFFFFWRQIYKLYQSSDYIAESKFLLFMELAFIEKLEFFSIQIPVKKLIFPPKNLEKIRAPKIRMRRFFFFFKEMSIKLIYLSSLFSCVTFYFFIEIK